MALNNEQRTFKSNVSLFKWLQEKKVALILIASSNWVIEKNSAVKSLNEACLRMIDFSACDMGLIRKIAVVLLASRLSELFPRIAALTESQNSIFFICSRSFSNSLRFYVESQTGSFTTFFSLINSMRHRRKQRSSFSVIFFFVSSLSRKKLNGLRMENCFLKIFVFFSGFRKKTEQKWN